MPYVLLKHFLICSRHYHPFRVTALRLPGFFGIKVIQMGFPPDKLSGFCNFYSFENGFIGFHNSGRYAGLIITVNPCGVDLIGASNVCPGISVKNSPNRFFAKSR